MQIAPAICNGQHAAAASIPVMSSADSSFWVHIAVHASPCAAISGLVSGGKRMFELMSTISLHQANPGRGQAAHPCTILLHVLGRPKTSSQPVCGACMQATQSIKKQRLSTTGTPVADVEHHDVQGTRKDLAKANSTACGSCYGAETAVLSCCNTCEDVSAGRIPQVHHACDRSVLMPACHVYSWTSSCAPEPYPGGVMR